MMVQVAVTEEWLQERGSKRWACVAKIAGKICAKKQLKSMKADG